MSESIIQQGIVCYLSSIAHKYNFLFFSVPNESSASGKTGKDFGRTMNLKKMGVTPGVSDLVIGHNGRMFCLEVKTATGKQSPNQVLFQSWCESCKVPYRVVRDIEETARALVEWGIIGE